MDLRRLRDLLLPPESQDVGFLSELRQLSQVALRAMGWTELALAIFVFLARMVTDALVPGHVAVHDAPIAARAWQAALVILVALATLAVARTRLGCRRPALFLCISGWTSSAVVIASS